MQVKRIKAALYSCTEQTNTEKKQNEETKMFTIYK